MEIKEKKEVTEVKEVTVGHKCDNCGKVVNKVNFPDEWHSFSSQHREWGNDSCDSFEYYEVCSPECYIDKFTKIVEVEMKDRHDAEINEMEIQFARRLVEYFKRVGKNI